MVTTWNQKPKEPTRRDEIMFFICTFAKENNGVTPSVRRIAKTFGLHLSSVQTHIRKLEKENRISWIDEEKRYRVEESTWEEPPDIEL